MTNNRNGNRFVACAVTLIALVALAVGLLYFVL